MLSRIILITKQEGFRRVLVLVVAKLLGVDIGIKHAKSKAWSILLKKYNHHIAYGPFKGMKLNQSEWWAKNDRITQTLGTYEEHILEKLMSFSRSGSSILIDVGAADGYFAVGAVYSKLYQRVVAFEIDENSQKRILKNAVANNCDTKIEIHGEADIASIRNALHSQKKATVLIDIEGAEYKLLTPDMLSTLAGHYVICELHPWRVDEGDSCEKSLLENASKFFEVQLIKRENYSPNRFPELDDLTDEERLIAVAEGRGRNMKWLVLHPK